MKTFEKIETLYAFDQNAKKFNHEIIFNENVKNLYNYNWIFTEKIDGTNFRLYWNGYNLQYAGRTDNATFSAKQTDWIKAHICNEEIEIEIEQLFGNKEIYIFGEFFGNDIQKYAKQYSETYRFIVFDIMVNNIYLQRHDMEIICAKMGFDIVPVVLIGNIDSAVHYVLDTDKSTISNAPLEGVVGKPLGDLRDRLGNRIMVKIKRKDLEKTI